MEKQRPKCMVFFEFGCPDTRDMRKPCGDYVGCAAWDGKTCRANDPGYDTFTPAEKVAALTTALEELGFVVTIQPKCPICGSTTFCICSGR